METFSTLLALCEGKPPVTGGFPSQRPTTRSFDDFFDLRLKRRLSKQWKAGDLTRHHTLWSVPEQTFKQIIETPVIRDAIALIMASM